MSDHDEVLAREREFWHAAGDAGFYREHFAEDGRCVFPMAILDKAQTVASMEGATPWEDVEMREVDLLDVAPDAVAVTYAATARRAAGEPYEANVTSVYVRRDGAWQLLLHQQTPRG